MKHGKMMIMISNLIPCACGCGKTRSKYDKRGKIMKFINGHHNSSRIRKYSEEERKRRSIVKKGSNNPMWKGDKVGYKSLHEWVRNHLPIPNNCQMCNKIVSYLDLANITGIYNREFVNWKYMCRRCHMISDNRILLNRKLVLGVTIK